MPYPLRNSFYKDSKNVISENQISLLQFENWRGNKLKEFFNPVANIIANQGSDTRRSNKLNFESKISGDKIKCWFCSNSHKITKCQEFVNLPLDEKRKFVSEKNLCYNYLSNNHAIRNCKSEKHCLKPNCSKRHHTLLHFEKPQENSIDQKESVTSKRVCDHFERQNIIKTNAILDTGSDATLIRQDVARKLNLQGSSRKLEITNVFLDSSHFNSKLVNFKISSSSHPKAIEITNAFIVTNLNSNTKPVDPNVLKDTFPHLSDVNLPKLYNCDVTILISTDFPQLLVNHEYRCCDDENNPFAVRTKLGWVLMGSKTNRNQVNLNFSETNISLEEFWKIENYGTLNKFLPALMTKDEKRADELLEKTTKLIKRHYEVGILWKTDSPKLPYNRELAVKRLDSLERKFSRNLEFAKKYVSNMKQYFDSGYSRYLTTSEAKNITDITNYIPHHGVIHPKKPGKLRIVFDAASKFSNTSLNSHLLKGPDLLNNLVTVLMRFRQGYYAASADIEQMFHQVHVCPPDQNALRFLFIWKI